MAVDDSKLLYSSQWDIDQLISTGDLAVSTGTTTIHTIASAVDPSTYTVQFKPVSQSKWFNCGTGSTSGGASFFSFVAYIDGPALKVKTTVAGTARYRVWEDSIT